MRRFASINFIDFKKAFGSIFRDFPRESSFWYASSAKILFAASRLHSIRDPNPIYNPLYNDQSSTDRPRDMQWNMLSYLEDNGVAEDLVIFVQSHLQKNTIRLDSCIK